MEVKSWFRTFTVLALPPVGRTVEQKSFFFLKKRENTKLVIFFIVNIVNIFFIMNIGAFDCFNAILYN